MLELVRPDERPADVAAATRHGYLDLLGAAGPASTGRAQDLMLGGIVPRIYERWWRPGLGRLFKGALGPSMADEHRLARMLLGLAPGDAVLDVACGPGNFTRTFARAVGERGLAAGIDVSPTMLARAVRDTPTADHPAAAYVRGDAVRLPFRDASFDDMARVLTPGGRIALLTTCRTRSAPMRTIDGVLGAQSGQRMFERDEILTALESRGFGDLRQRVSGFAQIVGGVKG